MMIEIHIECNYDDVKDIIYELYKLMENHEGRIAHIKVED